LHPETLVGLRRSSLVKPKHPPAPQAERIEFAPTQLDMGPGVRTTVPPTPMATSDFTGPTPKDLLERAAALGPSRYTESFVLPSDPILQAKRQPEIAERRARLRRVVKGMLGVCGGVCILAIVVSVVSGGPETASAATSSEATRSAPSKSVVTVQKMDAGVRGKAPATFATTAVALRRPPTGKHR
jgi:hypothetical protein